MEQKEATGATFDGQVKLDANGDILSKEERLADGSDTAEERLADGGDTADLNQLDKDGNGRAAKSHKKKSKRKKKKKRSVSAVRQQLSVSVLQF